MPRFNPNLVRLRLGSLLSSRRTVVRCFNPNLVRLRRPRTHHPQPNKSQFQSQLGSIKTLHFPLHDDAAVRFQSQLGSIKTCQQPAVSHRGNSRFNPNLVRLRLRDVQREQGSRARFNPNLVRLRREGFRGGREVVAPFQSQLGSIKTSVVLVTLHDDPGFNPNLVRLRRV